MKNTNKTTTTATTTNATQTKLENLMQERNRLIAWTDYNANALEECENWQSINAEIMQTLSEMATYKTLKFLMANNATNGTSTETTDNGTTNTYGYNMARKLFNNAYNDIRILNNPHILTDILTDTADLIQESNRALTPYFMRAVVFNLDDVIYTKVLKNGNEKSYNAFQWACKNIRAYISAQDKKTYKKLAYCVGYTDNGKEVTTTKKPKNDITDIEQEQRTEFIKRYPLTALQMEIVLSVINGKTIKEIADEKQLTTRAVQKAFARAKENILKVDKRIQL